MIEQLTDDERSLFKQGLLTRDDCKRFLRIIDAHAADRAALVAQLEAAKSARHPDTVRMAAAAVLLEDAKAHVPSVEWDRTCGALLEDFYADESTTAAPTHADRAALVAQLEAANGLLGRIGVWADGYGSALVPHGGATDSFGDGVRCCKRQVKELLASAPHSTTHSALVAQVEELTRERDTAEIHERELRALQLEHESEVARLTRERDEARAVMMIQDEPDDCSRCEATMDGHVAATGDICHDCWNQLESEVARLTKALAAEKQLRAIAQRGEDAACATANSAVAGREAAEARVRELELLNQRHAELAAEWQQTARDAQADLAVLRTECEKLKARVERYTPSATIDNDQALLDAMREVRISRMGLDGTPYIQNDGRLHEATLREIERRETKRGVGAGAGAANSTRKQ